MHLKTQSLVHSRLGEKHLISIQAKNVFQPIFNLVHQSNSSGIIFIIFTHASLQKMNRITQDESMGPVKNYWFSWPSYPIFYMNIVNEKTKDALITWVHAHHVHIPLIQAQNGSIQPCKLCCRYYEPCIIIRVYYSLCCLLREIKNGHSSECPIRFHRTKK